MRRKEWDKASMRRLVKAWNEGVTARDLAKRFGVSLGRIHDVIVTARESGEFGDVREGQNHNFTCQLVP